jgi:hypothetical protein
MHEQRLLLVALTLAMGELGCRPGPGEPGLKWTKRWATGVSLSAVAWSGRQFVAVGCCSIVTSPDGVTWKLALAEEGVAADQAGVPPMPGEWQFESITWGGSQFVAVGRVVERPNRPERALIATSPDGVTWTERSASATARILQDVAWSGDRFVAMGDSILTSPDGVMWSAQRTPVDGSWHSVTWAGSQFIAVGVKSVATPPDGAPARRITSSFMTSPDGVTWTERGALPAFRLAEDVAWSGERFVAVGRGLIHTSPDAMTWSAHEPPVKPVWEAVIWSGSQFVAVGDHAIATSPDGVTWTRRPAPRGWFTDIAWSGTRFVAVGWVRRGWIVASPTALLVTSP